MCNRLVKNYFFILIVKIRALVGLFILIREGKCYRLLFFSFNIGNIFQGRNAYVLLMSLDIL